MGPRPGQFPEMMAQMTSLSNCTTMGPGGPDGMPLGRLSTNPPPLSHPNPHPSQQNLHHGMSRTNMGVMPHGGGDGSCSQSIAETGETQTQGNEYGIRNSPRVSIQGDGVEL